MLAKILFLIYGHSTIKFHRILIEKHVLITMIWHCLRICMKLSKNLKIFAFWLVISNVLLIKVKNFLFRNWYTRGLFIESKVSSPKLCFTQGSENGLAIKNITFLSLKNLKSKRRVCDWGPCTWGFVELATSCWWPFYLQQDN